MAIPYGQGSANPTFRPSDLDANQVLQHAFDESTARLRVDASIGLSDGINVDIDHAEDSIRLGDGINLVTTTVDGGTVGLDVNLISPVELIRDGIGVDFDVANISMAIAGSEYSYGIVSGTKKITIKSREKGALQLARNAGQSGTNYISIPPGNSYTIDGIDSSVGVVLYFQSTKPADTLEIVYWI